MQEAMENRKITIRRGGEEIQTLLPPLWDQQINNTQGSEN